MSREYIPQRAQKVVNLNTKLNVGTITYPDGHVHVTVDNVAAGDEVTVICSFTQMSDFVMLLQVANAIKHIGATNRLLRIPYLLCARYDRLMGNRGESLDLEVAAQLINSAEFSMVQVLDPHSEATKFYIKNCYMSWSMTEKLCLEYTLPDPVLIIPDHGAEAHKDIRLAALKTTEFVQCTKSRDLTNGRIKLKVTNPTKCDARNCVVVDDLCDGGATFIEIAKQISPAHLTLIVTHGIFSKGLLDLARHYDEIIVSNSRPRLINYEEHSTSESFKFKLIPIEEYL